MGTRRGRGGTRIKTPHRLWLSCGPGNMTAAACADPAKFDMLRLELGYRETMSIVQVQLPDELKSMIDRQVAEGHAASEADYVAEALRLYADLLDSDDEIAEIVERAEADIAAGRYVTVRTGADSEVLHEAAMDRLRMRLATDASR